MTTVTQWHLKLKLIGPFIHGKQLLYCRLWETNRYVRVFVLLKCQCPVSPHSCCLDYLSYLPVPAPKFCTGVSFSSLCVSLGPRLLLCHSQVDPSCLLALLILLMSRFGFGKPLMSSVNIFKWFSGLLKLSVTVLLSLFSDVYWCFCPLVF